MTRKGRSCEEGIGRKVDYMRCKMDGVGKSKPRLIDGSEEFVVGGSVHPWSNNADGIT